MGWLCDISCSEWLQISYWKKRSTSKEHMITTSIANSVNEWLDSMISCETNKVSFKE